MDNNFYKILETFKQLNEGSTKEYYWSLADRMDREQFIDYTTSELGQSAEEMSEFWDSINGGFDEGSMTSAEQHSTGPKFSGYWKGTDARTPGQHMVGGADESVEECGKPMSLSDRLRARWAETKRETGLDEAGANNPAPNTAGVAATISDPAAQAKELAAAQQNINKIKSAGIPIPNVQQAAKTILKDPGNPKTPMNAQDKQVNQNLGLAMKNLLDKGNPSQVGQVAQALKQAQQGQ
jgi:hypothetical protein